MSRPVFEGIEFGDGLDLAVIEFVARENAEHVSGPEERDRDHQGAGECESVALSECKILCHDPAYVDGPFLQELFSGSIGSLACICPAC